MAIRASKMIAFTSMAMIVISSAVLAGRGGRGGGGGFRGGGGGGFRGGSFGGGSYRGGGMGAAGYRGGSMGGVAGYHGGGVGGASGFSGARAGSFGTARNYGGYSGVRGGAAGATVRGGSITTARGTDIRYGSASAGAIGGSRYGYGGVGRNGNGYGTGGLYGGYHNGWVHGYWPGHYGGWGYGGYGSGLYTGLGLWGLGSALYSDWGYGSYYNPYYTTPVVYVPGSSYNYSQPIDTTSPVPNSSVSTPAISTFDQARQAFMQGNYNQSLTLADQAIKSMPNDPAIHQFRAVTLFALKRYDDAAGTLYSVLSAGPGWDWTTFISMYPNIDIYTQQLRDLENFVTVQEKSASGHFLLAYLYLTAGQNDAASDQLKTVIALQPKDQVSSMLLKSIDKTKASAEAATPTSQVALVAVKTLEGTWSASPSKDTSINLIINVDGKFSWKVESKGKTPIVLEGQSTLGINVLTLVQSKEGSPMVGDVSKTDDDHFTFQALGGGPSDPGLAFSRVK